MLEKRPRRLVLAVGALAFCLVATLNSGGYRYGIGDQAFYVPAVIQHLNPALFPRDRTLLHVQDRFMAFDDVAAAVIRTSGIPLPVLAFGLYGVALVLMFTAAVSIGISLFGSWWSVAVTVALLTLRHRITQTGANSLEAYFHPRMLACGLGLWAVADVLKGRSLAALAVLVLAFLCHPTTGIWFSVWVLVAMLVAEPRWRLPVAATAVVSGCAVLWMLMSGPLRGHLSRMDPQWAAVLAGKDYIFPFDWTAAFWLVNLGYAAIIVAIYLFRRRRGLASTRELGLVAGAMALVCLFLVSWPLMSAWIALALQLQTSRVFWLLDLFATFYIAWLVTEHFGGRRTLAMGMMCLALVRGLYVTLQEHGGARIVSIGFPRDNWTDVMQWISKNTPAAAHVLADPDHAWKYGTSVRVAGERDVYLEDVKDVSVALYSRDVAMRVLGRIQDAAGFDSMTADRAVNLAKQYELDYLVTERDMVLPLAYRNAQFRVYTLSQRADK